jgi:hypothetical protein
MSAYQNEVAKRLANQTVAVMGAAIAMSIASSPFTMMNHG